jgi:hypothetical protein
MARIINSFDLAAPALSLLLVDLMPMPMKMAAIAAENMSPNKLLRLRLLLLLAFPNKILLEGVDLCLFSKLNSPSLRPKCLVKFFHFSFNVLQCVQSFNPSMFF